MKANQSVQEENASVLVEVNSTVGKLPKLSSLLELCSAKTVSPLFFLCPGVIPLDLFQMANSSSPPLQYSPSYAIFPPRLTSNNTSITYRAIEKKKGICDDNVPAASSGFCKKEGIHVSPRTFDCTYSSSGGIKNSRIRCQPFLRLVPQGRFSNRLSKSEGNMGCRVVVSLKERSSG